jgi:phosphate-selective porin OprO and OprP
VTGRATIAPVNADRRVVHLGSAFTFREPNDTNTDRLRDRFETHVTDIRLVDTGVIEGIDSITKANAEFTTVYERYSLQGEYLLTSINRNTALGSGLDFDGFYLLGSIFLTGDSRPYSLSRGNFGQVSPSKSLGNGGFWAWELAFSYHDIDLTDGEIDGGTQTMLGVALNWYPKKNLNFQINYKSVTDHGGGNFPGAEPSVLRARGQLYW